MYSESHMEEAAISLFIKRLADEDAGQYRCTAVYAGNRELEAAVSVSIFRECCHLLLVTIHNIEFICETKGYKIEVDQRSVGCQFHQHFY